MICSFYFDRAKLNVMVAFFVFYRSSFTCANWQLCPLSITLTRNGTSPPETLVTGVADSGSLKERRYLRSLGVRHRTRICTPNFDQKKKYIQDDCFVL